MVFMFVMVSGMIKIYDATASPNANITTQAIVTGGSLSIDTQGQVNYSSVTLNAAAQNTTGNILQVNMRDPRGTGAGWSVTGLANNMQAGTNIISNVWIRWAPGDIYGLEGSSLTGVAAGPDYVGNFGDGARTLANTSTNNGMGNYCINDTMLNLTIGAGTPAGTYQNIVALTIS